MPDLLTQKQFDDLDIAIEWSQRQLEYPRTERINAVRQMVGKHYFQGGSEKKQPVPFITLATQIYMRQLAPQAPSVLITSQAPEMKFAANQFTLAVNQVPKEIGLTDTLQRWVLEAMYSPVGVVKVGLHTVGKILNHEYGQVFVDVVTFDDFFLDMSAKSLEEVQFMGNDYWVEFDKAKELYPGKLDDHEPEDNSSMSEDGRERAEGVSVDESVTEYKRRIQLRDVWLPEEGLFITYAVQAKVRLEEREWESSDVRPYYLLGFNKVPGNLLPLPQISLWRDLDELGNALYRKLATQADSQKSVLGFSGGDDEAAQDFKKASDCSGIKWSGQEPKELRVGGVDQTTLAFFMVNKELQSYHAGNIDSIGGLAPQAQTLGQDRMLTEAASAQIRDMASKVTDAVREVFRAIAYYEWNDPIRERVLDLPIPGYEEETIPVVWDGEAKEGNFDIYDLDIDPYSGQDNSPGVRLQKLLALMERVVYPLVPVIEMQGGFLDAKALIEKADRYSGLNEFGDIITWTDQKSEGERLQQPQTPRGANGQQGARGGMTDRGKNAVLQRVLMGDRPQASEMGG